MNDTENISRLLHLERGNAAARETNLQRAIDKLMEELEGHRHNITGDEDTNGGIRNNNNTSGSEAEDNNNISSSAAEENHVALKVAKVQKL